MSNQEASTVDEAFANVWAPRSGCPVSLHNDRGSTFMSSLSKKVFKEREINSTSTTAYHSQGDALIEPTIRKIEESLAKYVDEDHNTWSN